MTEKQREDIFKDMLNTLKSPQCCKHVNPHELDTKHGIKGILQDRVQEADTLFNQPFVAYCDDMITDIITDQKNARVIADICNISLDTAFQNIICTRLRHISNELADMYNNIRK